MAHTDNPEQKSSQADLQAKSYRPPELVEYGEIWEITGGAEPGDTDGWDSGHAGL